jgi:hypothetical protein
MPITALWSDTLEFPPQSTGNQRSSPSVNLSQKWANHNAFTAACMSARVMGMEKSYWDLGLITGALENKSKTVPQLEMDVAAAAQWFLHAGSEIWRTKADYGAVYGQDSELWKGKPGFSKERWNIWKERLATLEKDERLSDDTREAARKAVVAMGKTERAKK